MTTAFQLFNIAILLLGPVLILGGVLWLSRLKKAKDSAVKASAFILIALGIVATFLVRGIGGWFNARNGANRSLELHSPWSRPCTTTLRAGSLADYEEQEENK